MSQWMGNLFFRGASPTELEGMSWARLRYWNHWHEAMTQAEKKASGK